MTIQTRFSPVAWSVLRAVPAVLMLFAFGGHAKADPTLRTQLDVRGNFVIVGATLAHDCSGVPAPVVGTVGNCPDTNRTAPDVYWRADDPADGQARADDNIPADQARATSVLELPTDATVAHARLYWGAQWGQNAADDTVTLRTPDGVEQSVTADGTQLLAAPGAAGRFFYQSTADITALVMAQGSGAYRVADVSSDLGTGELASLAAWYMVVIFEQPGAPSRNLAIFDGLDYVDGSNDQSVSLSGFVVPQTGFDATLGVVAFEGETQFAGESLTFNGTLLSNGLNPADNFFNATRSRFGNPVTVVGDLPQLSGQPGSYSNMDMDIIDVTSQVTGGDTQASIGATSSLDIFLLTAFVTSISTLLPDYTDTTKTVTDENGGVPAPGDTLTYRFALENKGSDPSVQTRLVDVIPAGLTLVPGSIEITAGANMGPQTDAAGDDVADYDDASRTVTVRLGSDATATSGGTVGIGETAEVTFQVTVDADARGLIRNQGAIFAAGQSGAPEAETPTDNDLSVDGAGPTEVFVEECGEDAECPMDRPFCDIAASPRECVVCATSAQCTDEATPDCNDMGVCECAMGPNNCVDTDMDGSSDGAEQERGTDPMDADTDDDGVIDGQELAPDDDSDGDGVINALDPDSDNDGLPDGLEQGFGCDNGDTDVTKGFCRADGDGGATTTNPTKADTDDGGASDGSEDFDLDGVVDDGETDPTEGNGADDNSVQDTDDDGLGNDLEETLNSDPMDADTDNDGVIDGREPNPSGDDDGDGLNGVLDTDSDNDGLFDGTELGLGCDGAQTDTSEGHCRPDADLGATTTSPVIADTDGGGVRDGSEDTDLNGRVDPGETDPTAGNGADDSSNVDTDGDGLSDALETGLGADPTDGDSDDDGVPDGEEANPSDDTDGDGLVNVLDPDSDGDGLFDGTEQGLGCGAATDTSKQTCVADADPGTTTSPVNPDTDFGGVLDASEDANRNGRVDPGETNPTAGNGGDDGECGLDLDCGDDTSGQVCVNNMCVEGCRSVDGNGCPDGLACTSVGDGVGMCESPNYGGGGCNCDLGGHRRVHRSGQGEHDLRALLSLLSLLVLGLGVWIRRRRS